MAVITEEIGDIFTAPPRSVLIHACNNQGSWGAGVALAFKQKYPNAYKIYNNHCKSPPPPIISLTGTCLLISPQLEDQGEHYIACLFTSPKYGRQKAPEDKILEYTKLAIEDLATQLEALRQGKGAEVGDLWAVRINSGKFGVRWKRSREVLEEGSLSMKVVRPANEDKNNSPQKSTSEGREPKRRRTADTTGPLINSGRDHAVGSGIGISKQVKQMKIDQWFL